MSWPGLSRPSRFIEFSAKGIEIAGTSPAMTRRVEASSRLKLNFVVTGSSAFAEDDSQETIDALKGVESARPADPARCVAELEAQAAELEVKARDLRSRIAALKKPEAAASDAKGKDAGSGTSE